MTAMASPTRQTLESEQAKGDKGTSDETLRQGLNAECYPASVPAHEQMSPSSWILERTLTHR